MTLCIKATEDELGQLKIDPTLSDETFNLKFNNVHILSITTGVNEPNMFSLCTPGPLSPPEFNYEIEAFSIRPIEVENKKKETVQSKPKEKVEKKSEYISW